MAFLDLFKTKNISMNQVDTKSANIDSSNINYQLVVGNQLKSCTNLSPKELIEYNTHWVFICNSKNANTCASVPLRLYYENKSGKKVVNGVPVEVSNNIVEITQHPFLDL